MIISQQDHFRSFIDRILRIKQEQDTLASDIREVYAEAKYCGYDKTIMGKVVAHLRKVDKDGEPRITEAAELFDAYLGAYRGTGTPLATRGHAHEGEPDHDPATGEIFESPAQSFPSFEIPEPRDSTGDGGRLTEETDDVGGSGGPEGQVLSSMKSSGPADSIPISASDAATIAAERAGGSAGAASPADFPDPGDIPAFLRRPRMVAA